ncbi:MAG: glycine cleavage system protein GcvH [Promethearchaeota archaeon]
MDEVKIPKGLKYTDSHEWLKKNDNGSVLIGITDFAQKSLGDIVFVDFTVDVNDELSKGGSFCEIESVKAVESVFMPISGIIIGINRKLDEDCSVLNTSPYEDGWLLEVKIENQEEMSNLLDAAAYSDVVKAEAQH